MELSNGKQLENLNEINSNNKINQNDNNNIITPSSRKLKREYKQLIPLVQNILKKGLRNRTPKDISDLYEFLEMTRFAYNMREEIEEGHLDLQQLLFFSTQFMTIKTYNSKDVIYYEGEVAENIYVLLEGEVNLFKINYINKEMKSHEYYRYLYYMNKNNNDPFLLNKTVKVNKNVFPIYKNSDIEIFDEILFKIEFCELLYEGDLQRVMNFIRYYKKDLNDFEFESIRLGEMSMNDYFQKTLSSLNESEDFYFTHVRNEPKKIKILSNFVIKSLEEKEYFGRFTLEDEGDIRRESAFCEKDDTLLLVINKRLYSGCITTEQIEVKEKEVDKVYYGTVFMSIRRFNFDKYYFYNFDKVELSKGEELYSENQKVDYIYLLKNGLIEVYLPNKNIFDIKKLIKKFKEFEIIFQKNEYDDTLKLKNSLTSLQDYIKIRNNYSLYVCNTKESFGIWEYNYNNRMSLYSVKIKSDKATLFRMSIDNFLDDKPDHEKVPDSELLKKAIKNEAFEQVKNNIERLIFIKNSVLMKIDFEYTKKKKDEEEEYIPKLNIFEVKNIMKPINYNFHFNKHLINLLKTQRQRKSIDYKQHFNTNNNYISNLKKFISHKPAKSFISLNKNKKDKLKLNFSDDSENSKTIISIKQIKNHYSRNLNNDRQFQNELNHIKSDMNKDSFLYFHNPFITESVTLPKIKSPQRKKSPVFLKMKTELSRDNIKKRSLSNNNKEILLKPINNNNSQRNLNYLAIKEFYSNFNSSLKKDKVKRFINKSTK